MIPQEITLIDLPADFKAHEARAAMFKRGDVFQCLDHEGNSQWMICCPKCGVYSSLRKHTCQNNGGLLTFSPSLVCPHEKCGAHYFIKENQIEWT